MSNVRNRCGIPLRTPATAGGGRHNRFDSHGQRSRPKRKAPHFSHLVALMVFLRLPNSPSLGRRRRPNKARIAKATRKSVAILTIRHLITTGSDTVVVRFAQSDGQYDLGRVDVCPCPTQGLPDRIAITIPRYAGSAAIRTEETGGVSLVPINFDRRIEGQLRFKRIRHCPNAHGRLRSAVPTGMEFLAEMPAPLLQVNKTTLHFRRQRKRVRCRAIYRGCPRTINPSA